MGTKRVGLARVEALMENLKREIALGGAGLTGLNSLAFSSESVEGGVNAGAGTALSVTVPVSFVTTATDKGHVTLAAGAAGAIKIVVHAVLGNAVSCVITPASYSGGTNLTSNAAGTVNILISDGTNWHSLETAGWTIA